MDFTLSEEQQMLRDLCARFRDDYVRPLEPKVLAREAGGGASSLLPEEQAVLDARAKELGLYALDGPEEYGGSKASGERYHHGDGGYEQRSHHQWQHAIGGWFKDRGPAGTGEEVP